MSRIACNVFSGSIVIGLVQNQTILYTNYVHYCFGALPMSENINLAGLLGIKPTRIGKTEARQNFLPLVSELVRQPGAIEITDHDQPVAVLVSHSHWAAIMSKLAQSNNQSPPVDLRGSVKIIGDLEAASKEAGQELLQSVKRRAKNL